VFRNMEKWVEIRRKVLANEASKRAICREYKLHWDTLQRILKYPEPPEYQQKGPRKRPKIGEFLPIIHEILKSDQQVHRKQRHTAKRIFERLQVEHEYAGGYTGVKDAVRAWRQQHKEVFLPLSHPPGEAQVDFGEADVTLRGETTRVALFVMTLPYSDAIFCQVFPRECTEAFLEGHRRAFEFFGGVPRRISYDNSKIAVAKITGSREREVTGEFLRLESHYLFEHHFCLVRRPNEKGHVERLLDFARANFLVPVPVTDDLTRLNESLEQNWTSPSLWSIGICRSVSGSCGDVWRQSGRAKGLASSSGCCGSWSMPVQGSWARQSTTHWTSAPRKPTPFASSWNTGGSNRSSCSAWTAGRTWPTWSSSRHI